MAANDSRIIWTVRKLASQGPGFLPRRLRSIVQKGWVNHAFPTARMERRAEFSVPEPTTDSTLRQHLAARPAPRWHWIEANVSSIVRTVPNARRARTISQAENIVVSKFGFRGKSPLDLAPGNWSPDGVSVGWTWDLNRHHWFATLGFAYWYTGDTRFLRCFVERSSDWMDRHLSRLGRIPWDTPFEVASRINAWLWAHFLFLSSPEWPSSHHKRFVHGLGLLAEYLNQSIEYHCPGNHILLEAKTLALVGEVFPEFGGSAQWRRKGWNVLDRELQRQICSDGVHAERSTMYHRIVAGELAELWHFCLRNDHSRAAGLGESVRRMADFQHWTDQGNESRPLFGDAHIEDTYQRFSAPEVADAACGNFTQFLTTELTDHTHWLLDGPSYEESTAQPAQEMPSGRAFPDGGYFVARSSWKENSDVLVWDCGPAGYQVNRKHAHLDTLSFTLSVAGTPLLIDPGAHEGQHQEQPLRNTRVHSTICIDREEQGILARRGEIWSPPRPELLLWASSQECTVMAGRHDGYRRLRDPVQVARTIVVVHGLYWLIVDSVTGFGRHLIEQRFHVVPGAEVTASAESGGVEVSKSNVALSLFWAAPAASRPSESKIALPQVRIEPSLAELYCGRPEPSSIISAERLGPVPFDLAVVASSAGRDVRVHWDGGADRPGWLVVTGTHFEHYVYAGCATGRAAPLPGDWRTDACFAIIRQKGRGKPQDMLLPSASSVWRQNRENEPLRDDGGGIGSVRRIVLE